MFIQYNLISPDNVNIIRKSIPKMYVINNVNIVFWIMNFHVCNILQDLSDIYGEILTRKCISLLRMMRGDIDSA